MRFQGRTSCRARRKAVPRGQTKWGGSSSIAVWGIAVVGREGPQSLCPASIAISVRMRRDSRAPRVRADSVRNAGLTPLAIRWMTHLCGLAAHGERTQWPDDVISAQGCGQKNGEGAHGSQTWFQRVPALGDSSRKRPSDSFPRKDFTRESCDNARDEPVAVKSHPPCTSLGPAVTTVIHSLHGPPTI